MKHPTKEKISLLASVSCSLWTTDRFGNDMILLVKTVKDGKWGLPAGHVEAIDVPEDKVINSCFEAALVREIQEELNLDVYAEDVKLVSTDFHYVDGKFYAHRMFDLYKDHDSINTDYRNNEIAQIMWFYLLDLAREFDRTCSNFRYNIESFLARTDVIDIVSHQNRSFIW